MRTSSLIGHTIEALDIIRRGKQPADNALRDFFRARHYLGSKDRRYIADLVYGVLRNSLLMRVYIDEALKASGVSGGDRAIFPLAECAAFLLKIARAPLESVQADCSGLFLMSAPSIDGNAFLRALQAAALPEHLRNDPARRIAALNSLPVPVVEEWMERYGEEEAERLCCALNAPAPVTLRVNTLKCTVEECRGALEAVGVACDPTRLSPWGLTLGRRVNNQALAPYRNGWFEMQDEGSQLLSPLLGVCPGALVVDACAGAGGKTLHLAALMNNRGSLIALDVEEERLGRLQERARRAGASIVRTLHARTDSAAVEFMGGTADAVLVDAPCSGTGTFRRNPGAKEGFAEEIAAAYPRLQRDLLARYAALVKPGGRLVYSTCTLLRRENEATVEEFLRAHAEFSILPAAELLAGCGIPVQEGSAYLHLFPHIHATDGFFAAALQRTPQSR